MESYELENGQTIPKGMPFADSEDRRSHPRVPFSAPIRLGPPNDVVCSMLHLEDLSMGGMFIRCPEPVQVGARFSAELELPGGRSLYVPEAEVRYNRNEGGDRTPGFGAAFITMSADARQLLNEVTTFDSDIDMSADVTRSMILDAKTDGPNDATEYDDSQPPVMPRVSDLRLASRVPNIAEAKTVQVEDWQVQIKPHGIDLDEESFDTDTTFIRPTSEKDVPTDEIRAADPDEFAMTEPPTESSREIDAVDVLRHELCLAEEAPNKKPRHRSHPTRGHARALTGIVFLCAGIAILLVKLIDSATSTPDAYAETPSFETNGLSARTHTTLLKNDSSYLGLEPKSGESSRSASGEARHALPPLVDVDALAPHAAKAKEVKKALTTAAPKPAPTPQKEESEAPAPKPVAKKSAHSSGTSGSTIVGLKNGARLKRSFALKSPPRFVVDIEGQVGEPTIGRTPAGVARVRVGRHDDYTRLVFDAEGPIKSAKAVQRDGEIEVHMGL